MQSWGLELQHGPGRFLLFVAPADFPEELAQFPTFAAGAAALARISWTSVLPGLRQQTFHLPGSRHFPSSLPQRVGAVWEGWGLAGICTPGCHKDPHAHHRASIPDVTDSKNP